MLFGNHQEVRKAKNFLVERSEEAISQVTEAWIRFRDKEGWSPFTSIADRLWRKYPVQAAHLLESRFLTGDASLKKFIAPYLSQLVKNKEVKGLKELLIKLLNYSNFHTHDAIEDGLATIAGKQTVVREYLNLLDNQSVSRELVSRAFQYFEWNYEAALPLLKPILSDTNSPFRSQVRELMTNSWNQYFFKGKHRVPPAVIERTRQWLDDKDPYVRNSAALALIGCGIKIPEQLLVGLLKSDNNELLELTAEAFKGMAASDENYVDYYIKGLFRKALMLAKSPDTKDTGLSLLEKLMGVETAGSLELIVAALQDPLLTTPIRETITWKLSWWKKRMNKQTRISLLRNVSLFSLEANVAHSYAAFLERLSQPHNVLDVRENLRNAAVTLIKDALLTLTSENQVEKPDPYVLEKILLESLGALQPVVEKEDFPMIRQLIESKKVSLNVKAAALELLAEVEVPRTFIEVLKGFFTNDRLALAAAKASSRYALPEALTILVEKGLKRMGFYSGIFPEPSLFVPYGQKGVDALMNLMDYPNDFTRKWVRVLLAELKAQDAYQPLKEEYMSYIHQQEAPPPHLVVCMILYGQKVLPEVVDILVQKKGKADILSYHFYLVKDIALQQLKEILLKENDIRRAKVIIQYIKRLSGYYEDDINRLLEELKASHSNKEIIQLMD